MQLACTVLQLSCKPMNDFSCCFVRIFLNELNGNPNKKNSHNETCLHILCSSPSQTVTAEESEVRLLCVDLLLQWTGPVDQTDGDEEKIDLGAVDEVNAVNADDWSSELRRPQYDL